MAVARQFGREASIYLAGFVGAGILQFLAVPIYSRALGPGQYGYLTLTIATATVLSGVMVLGGDLALARFWAEARTEEERSTLASTWIAFLTLWSILIAGIACALAPRLAEALSPGAGLAVLLGVGFLGMVPAQLSRMLAQVLRNRFRPVPYAATTVVVAAMNTGLGVLLGVALDLGVLGVVLGTLLGESLGCAVRYPLVRHSLGARFSLSLLPPLLRFGVPYVPASVAMWAFTGADRVVVGTMTSDVTGLGSYGLAASLVASFTVVTLSLGQAWIPRITAMHVTDPDRASDVTSRAILLALTGLGTAATAAGAVAPWIISVVGGGEYSAGATALPLLALGAALYGTASFAGTGLVLVRRTGTMSIMTTGAAAIDVALLLALVPRLGLVGAALSVALAQLTLCFGMLLLSGRVYPLSVPKLRLAAGCAIFMCQALFASARHGSGTVLLTGVVTCALVPVVLLGRRLPSRLP